MLECILKYIKTSIRIKKLVLILSIVILPCFTGCSNKKDAVGEEKKQVVKQDIKVKKETTKKKNPEIVNKQEHKEHTNKEAKAKKIKNKVIVIDPGHANRSNLEKERVSPDSGEMKIKDGGGAEGINSKTPEYVITMKVALKLKQALEEEGYKVIMTKTEDSQSLGNIERAQIGNQNKADLVIRIHADSSENTSVNGASMLVPVSKGYAKSVSGISKNYGTIILKKMVDTANMKSRGIIEREDMTGFNWSEVPVVLVEMGFLSNPKEDSLLNTEGYREKIVQGLTKGIKEALN